MGRLMAIDYGLKRVGIAVTDPDKIIATALNTIETVKLMDFIRQYVSRETVEEIIVGEPKQMNNQPSQIEGNIKTFIDQLHKFLPEMRIVRFDERFTSKMAFQTMIDSGINRKARQNKALVDSISATIILQSYMESK